MKDALRTLLLMFYAPARGMREARDRSSLGAALLIAFVADVAHSFISQWAILASEFSRSGGVAAFALSASARIWLLGFAVVWNGLMMTVGVCVIFAPIVIFAANLFERRGSFALVVRQEFASIASVALYAWAAACLITIPIALVLHLTGFYKSFAQTFRQAKEIQSAIKPDEPPPPGAVELMLRFFGQFIVWVLLSPLLFFLAWMIIGLREAFRFSVWRAIVTIGVACILVIPAGLVFGFLFSTVLGSPFILLLLFWLMRGYFQDAARNQRARASFKQNLEAATLNPADASAHYNLGLIHLERKELEEAKARFKRAVEIDPDEVDAHYQLGRIARMQNQLPEAIAHFGDAVARAPQHAQNEVWREIGATYLAANQFADARDALERFLGERPSDAEGLYLMGRALAGLGQMRDAIDSMRACIEAVKTAPAYKYRTEKRWMGEAQQFLRSQQASASH